MAAPISGNGMYFRAEIIQTGACMKHLKLSIGGGLIALGLAVLSGTSHANPSEVYTECRVPVEVKFAREWTGWAWVNNRYTRYAGEALTLRDYKNPEAHTESGPKHMSNCSGQPPNTTRMRMQFKMKTTNFYTGYPTAMSDGIGNHAVMMLKASFFGTPSYNPVTYFQPVTYMGRGIIFARWPPCPVGQPCNHTHDGIDGELFDTYNNPSYNQLEQNAYAVPLYDTVEYSSDVWVSTTGVSYTVTDGTHTANQPDWHELPTALNLNGAGWGFAVLCNGGAGLQCEVDSSPHNPNPAFEVRFYDISLTWYQ